MSDLIFGDDSVHYGYGKKNWAKDSKDHREFFFSALPVRRPLLGHREEMINAAKQVYERYGEEIYVYFSGGTDSEAVAEAFRYAGVPHCLVILRDTEGANHKELVLARDYINRMTPKRIKLVECNFKKWAKSKEARVFADKTNQPFGALNILFYPFLHGQILSKDLVVVMGNGEPSLVYDMRSKEWGLYESEHYYSLYRAFMELKLKGTPCFHQWSAELHYSFVSDPLWDKVCRNGIPGLNTSDNSGAKSAFWLKHMNLPPRKKDAWAMNVNRPYDIYLFNKTFFRQRDKWLEEHRGVLAAE